jgi:hypothetical protein
LSHKFAVGIEVPSWVEELASEVAIAAFPTIVFLGFFEKSHHSGYPISS